MADPSASGTPSHAPATLAIHGLDEDRTPGAPVVSPLVQSATFHWAEPSHGELLYSRYGNNPNQTRIGSRIAALEGMEAGLGLSSGMGATAMSLLALARSGDHIVASAQLYGATQALLRDELPHRGITTTFVDPESGDWAAAMKPTTRAVMIEVPTNPTLRVMDPRPVAEIAHARGALLVCDATFASPSNFRAREMGIDVVIHSATKYLGGHSDLIAGVVAGPADVITEVTRLSRLYGPSMDPHTAWLLDRGIRTLDVRVERHNRNAHTLAEWFEGRPEVLRSIYPGLPSHPDHETAAEVLNGFGGMLSIVLRDGGDAADRFLSRLRLAIAAPSLGGVETLVSQPRFTSHMGLTREDREAMGIPDGFVRISVGIEDVGDLIADFGQALAE